VERIRRGEPDANGQPALTRIAEGVANPCRHGFELIAEGDEKLVLAYRPVASLQPYAETGPIFLNKTSCERYRSDHLPAWFDFMDPAIIRGYGHDDWILGHPCERGEACSRPFDSWARVDDKVAR
jgi:hypothetical protein